MKTIAMCNQKGGVGKSTTTFHLARAARLAGLRTLVVDMDPQGNITSVLAGEDVAEGCVGMADVLSARTRLPLADVLVDTAWRDIRLAPTTGDVLAYVRDELIIAGAGREGRLRAALGAVADVDLVLIDCPPSLDQLTINALAAADELVVVTQPRLWSTDGIARLLTTVEAVRTYYNPQLVTRGIVVNLFDDRTVGARHWMKELTENTERLGIPILGEPIPKRVAIADSAEAGLGLDEWPTGSELATLYTRLLEEVIR